MSDHGRRRVWSTLLGIVGVLLVTATVVLLLVGRAAPWPDAAWIGRGPAVLIGLIVPISWLLTHRRPDNPVGWLLSLAGMSYIFNSLCLAAVVVASDRGATTTAIWVAWLVAWSWVPAVVLTLLALARFPTGRLPSRRWRILDVAALLSIVGWATQEALRPGALQNVEWFENPIVVPPDTWRSIALLVSPANVALVVLSVGTILALGGRFRRSQGVERQQLRWIGYTSVPFALTLLLGGFMEAVNADIGPSRGLLAYVNTTSLMLMLGAIALAILRYRLYDLDLFVSRTITYTLLTGSLVGVYLLSVMVLGTLVRDLAGGQSDSLVVAASTLLAAALFAPLRRRLQDLIDRRLHRRHFDARQAIVTLAANLRDEVDSDAVSALVVGAVGDNLQPASVGLWLPDDPIPARPVVEVPTPSPTASAGAGPAASSGAATTEDRPG